ncbi:DUF3581 domain-containing protein [Colwellia sp. 6M3]|jgi:hypothetical protein|uniref:DUF3581 family protein n=1 Tax=Colwellia sp. 6M3 TaxID=2759849 RepID=UPI0015F6A69E|nr:DUF3581 family protein [Colwellia sp. 6M3]MBA6414434.1 DUF3581 domain-containing protein [Colwellia sp. 6M3]|tara:strand:- start:1182 stop:1895 length:714 start_codon:yes stop_codon:yes gene_type:complete
MFLENYCQITDDKISFTRQQASDFAKQIADDFNPLHDIQAKRFCVPGDLLFSLILERAGLHKEMSFKFSGMVTDATKLTIPTEITTAASIVDDNQKEYLNMSVSGDYTKSSKTITALTRAYVEFSGHTFPHILVELMKECQVMINPTRPMIMYESMSIHLDNLDFEEVTLKLSSTTLDIDGKRGNACLSFDLVSKGQVIGNGKKFMLLSGLRDYCQETIDNIVTQYNDTKAQYLTQR